MEPISLPRLLLSLLPVAVVILVLARWSVGAKQSLVAFARMFVQLMLVGYVLTVIFDANSGFITLATCTFMAVVASLISLRTLESPDRRDYLKAFVAISVGGFTSLVVVTQLVLQIDPWYAPAKIIPLGGMALANAMTAISLAAERFHEKIDESASYESARNTAAKTALIPITNSLLAVGLVSIPGFMTGQIVQKADPLIAARYQIMVMGMVFGSAGLGTIIYLYLMKPPSESSP